MMSEHQEASGIGPKEVRSGECHSASTLGALLAQHARTGTFSEEVIDRPWKERQLGLALV
jgi:hypothetical protein